MASETPEQIIERAIACQRSGDLALAERLCQQILTQPPTAAARPKALYLLGVISGQRGNLPAAADLLRQAIVADPADPLAHGNLGNALAGIGQPQAAEKEYREALRLAPGYPEAHYNLGNLLQKAGRTDEALAAFASAVDHRPDYAAALFNLGKLLFEQGKLENSAAAFRRVVALKPDHAPALGLLVDILSRIGPLEECLNYCQHLLRLHPRAADLHGKLGDILRSLRRYREAMEEYREVLKLDPPHIGARINLAVLLQREGRLDEAEAFCREAINLRPEAPDARNVLGNVFKERGQLDEAIATYRSIIEKTPDYDVAHSNLLYVLHFHPDSNPQSLLQEHRKWNQIHAAQFAAHVKPHTNNPSPDRRLRIGYFSPNLYSHVVGRFMLPLIEAHDRTSVEIFCYPTMAISDPIASRLQAASDHWTPMWMMTEEQSAQRIRDDQIDILVDLAMHMGDNRLLLFARKPAPVQVAYLAYCSTTGLETIDYRLSDPFIDPPENDDSCYSETTVQLAETYWCYPPPIFPSPISSPSKLPPPVFPPLPQATAVRPTPALSQGHITFGSLNNFGKVSQNALQLWCELLAKVPHSRLILHSNLGDHRHTIEQMFARHGLATHRFELVPTLPIEDYFSLYHRIDIALDTFPYAGGTTTCDALYMGVPVVTLRGRTAVGRGGVSILSNLGLPELIAEMPAQYVQIAAALAADLPRLVTLRASMRSRMEHSPLMNPQRFAKNVEAAYRTMWHTWCAGQ